MKLLRQLWALEERERNKSGVDFSDIGLGLYDVNALPNANYDCTPVNSSTFAATGGDGVHFGLLHVAGEVVDDSAVVMTVPPNYGNTNLIVGANLYEFLCLGC